MSEQRDMEQEPEEFDLENFQLMLQQILDQQPEEPELAEQQVEEQHIEEQQLVQLPEQFDIESLRQSVRQLHDQQPDEIDVESFRLAVQQLVEQHLGIGPPEQYQLPVQQQPEEEYDPEDFQIQEQQPEEQQVDEQESSDDSSVSDVTTSESEDENERLERLGVPDEPGNPTWREALEDEFRNAKVVRMMSLAIPQPTEEQNYVYRVKDLLLYAKEFESECLTSSETYIDYMATMSAKNRELATSDEAKEVFYELAKQATARRNGQTDVAME